MTGFIPQLFMTLRKLRIRKVEVSCVQFYKSKNLRQSLESHETKLFTLENNQSSGEFLSPRQLPISYLASLKPPASFYEYKMTKIPVTQETLYFHFFH